MVVSGVRSSCDASETNCFCDSYASWRRFSMPLKLDASAATSSRLRGTGSRRAKSRLRPISSAATATAWSGARARPATSHEAMRAATSAGTADRIRKTTTPDRFACGTRVDWPATM